MNARYNHRSIGLDPGQRVARPREWRGGLLRMQRFTAWFLVACGCLLGATDGGAVTVKVDSTRQWLAWMNIWETDGTSFVSGGSWDTLSLPALFIPTNSPTGWPLNTRLILGPNTSTYNPGDPFWNFPEGSPNKILQTVFYVDVFTAFAGQTVIFTGLVVSNNIPGVAGTPTTGWQVVAFVKEFSTSYDYLGETSVPLRAGNSFVVARAIPPERVCQYGFSVVGPNAAPGSANALASAGIRVDDPDPLIVVPPTGGSFPKGTTIELSVAAVGGSSLTYRWKRNGLALVNAGNISGVNTPKLTIANARLSDSGDYSVAVIDGAGLTESPRVPVTVLCVLVDENQPFVIRQFPAGTNNSVTLTWDSCSSHLYEVQTTADPSGLAGWTPRALMIGSDDATTWKDTNAQAVERRFYRVQRLSFDGDQDGDGLANLDESTRGTDLHDRDSDHDGIPDGWEVKYGLNPRDPNDALADLDRDGYSNYQEYQRGTRPNAAYSRPADPPPNLLGWWKLDETTGTNVADSSLNGHQGYVVSGGPAGVWTTGYLSNAATVGGPASTWICVPWQPRLAPVGDLTLMGWVKPSGQGALIGNWSPAGGGNYLLLFGPNEIELRFSPMGDFSFSTLRFNPNWSTNEWHHLAACYSYGTNLAVFVDGEYRAGLAVSGQFVALTNPVLIGFPGLTDACLVDDVRLYDRALTASEFRSFSQGNGLPISMIVGQSARLRAFGAAEGDTCQWRAVSGTGFFTNAANLTADFIPSWSGAVTVQVVIGRSGVFYTNFSSTTVAFPALSPLSDWNDNSTVQFNNNCYNFSTDIRTDTRAQPGGPPFYYLYTCAQQINATVSDGLQAGVDLADLCHTSGLPDGHIIALLVWPGWDFHFVRLEANGMWSSKAGNYPATLLDNSGQPIVDPRTADFSPYQFCGFLWVGPNATILHYPQ